MNVADPDDPVATDPRLADRFDYEPAGDRTVEDVTVHNLGRAAWHSAKAYLSHDEVRAVVWEALDE